VGYSSTNNNEAHLTLWRGGPPVDLGDFTAGRLTIGTGLNNRGQIVGWGYTAEFEPHAFLWEDGEFIDLGTLPGGTSSFAMDINKKGEIAGVSNAADFETTVHAVVWNPRR
jgi:probable HAF family extracellular repeat protein